MYTLLRALQLEKSDVLSNYMFNYFDVLVW